MTLDTRPGERWGDLLIKVFVEELSPNGQTLNILWWLYKKHTWSYSCYRINWYPYHMPTVLREKPWDTRLAFSKNTAYTIPFTSRSVKFDIPRRELMTVMWFSYWVLQWWITITKTSFVVATFGLLLVHAVVTKEKQSSSPLHCFLPIILA